MEQLAPDLGSFVNKYDGRGQGYARTSVAIDSKW